MCMTIFLCITCWKTSESPELAWFYVHICICVWLCLYVYTSQYSGHHIRKAYARVCLMHVYVYPYICTCTQYIPHMKCFPTLLLSCIHTHTHNAQYLLSHTYAHTHNAQYLLPHTCAHTHNAQYLLSCIHMYTHITHNIHIMHTSTHIYPQYSLSCIHPSIHPYIHRHNIGFHAYIHTLTTYASAKCLSRHIHTYIHTCVHVRIRALHTWAIGLYVAS